MKKIFGFLMIIFSFVSIFAADNNYTRFWLNPGDSVIIGVAKNSQSVGVIKIFRPEKEKIMIEIFGKIRPKIYSDIKPVSTEKFSGDAIKHSISFPENSGAINISLCLPQKGLSTSQIFFGSCNNWKNRKQNRSAELSRR